VGLVTLVAIAAVAVPSVIIRIAAVVASVVAVLGLAFVHNVLAVVVVIAMIAFFSRAIDNIVENLITIVVNLVLQRSNITRRRRSLKGRANRPRSGGRSLLDTVIAIIEAKDGRAGRRVLPGSW
jgi:uncharacterized protein YacL